MTVNANLGQLLDQAFRLIQAVQCKLITFGCAILIKDNDNRDHINRTTESESKTGCEEKEKNT